MTTAQERVARLEAQIRQLQRQWPKHSLPPALMMELDELEEELEAARKAAEDEKGGARARPPLD